MATSQNGYTANQPSLVSSRLVPGTTRKLTVRKGSPGDLLLDMAAWFDKHVQDIDQARGALDDWGFAERPIRGSATELSNHASGTAIDLNATQHPLGKVGTFSKAQVAAIHSRLKVYDGCIRWGGDYQNRKDEMHFEIVASVPRCDAVLKKLTTTQPQEDDVLNADDKKWLDTRIGDVVTVPKNHPGYNPKNPVISLQRAAEISLQWQADHDKEKS